MGFIYNDKVFKEHMKQIINVYNIYLHNAAGTFEELFCMTIEFDEIIILVLVYQKYKMQASTIQHLKNLG